MTVLRTRRLLLIPATPESLRAELVAPSALGDVLDVDVPPSWPPELYDADAVRWTLAFLLEHPEDRLWSLYYVAEQVDAANPRPRLVGLCGYKGAPDVSGLVEIGYGVVPECRRRGYASEAVRALLATAFADPRVQAVIAHTLPELAPSIGVLRATGFTFEGPGNDPHEPTAIRFRLARRGYETGVVAGTQCQATDEAGDGLHT
jgi:RimJ/RimL family protein N-acetyltransferase